MAERVISSTGSYTGYSAAVSIDGSTDYMLIQSGGTYYKINRNVLMGVSGQPADISTAQNITNKTLDNTNILTLRDDRFTLQDSGDVTRQATFELSSITAGQTRVMTLPDASTTLVGTGVTQTLTNKTLTAPVINNGSITGTTITTDAIVGQTAATNGTVYGLTISGGKVGTNGVVTGSITDGAVTSAKVANGIVVQVVRTQTGAVSTGTTTIPYDDTIPQITEGDEYMTLAITPKSTTNILVIQVIVQLASSVADNLTTAIFQDSTANALAAIGQNNISTAGAAFCMVVTHSMPAATTSSTTFRVRAGGSQAGTRTFNGSAGVRRYGGVTVSSITITEYKA